MIPHISLKGKIQDSKVVWFAWLHCGVSCFVPKLGVLAFLPLYNSSVLSQATLL